MLEWLFNAHPADFARDELEFTIGYGSILVGIVIIAVAVAMVQGFAGGRGTAARRRDRIALWALRSAVLSVVFLLLLDPRLRVELAQPVRGFVAVVLDDSLSMRIADDGATSRGQRMLAAFAPDEGGLAEQLASRFETRFYRFAQRLEPLRGEDALSFNGARSNVAAALGRLAEPDNEGAELAAVVLVTDGAGGDLQAHAGDLATATAELQALGVVLHTVGVGAERFERDVELAEFVVPGSLLRGDAVEATIAVVQKGFDDREATVTIEDGGAIVAERTVTFERGRERSVVRMPLAFTASGPRRLVARVQRFDGELIAENNARVAQTHVRRSPIEVLHVEGEPRFEVKFLRRAVSGDDGIRLRSLVRTAENKFYRLGVDDASELPHGLPSDDASLFRYDAVVIGSVGDDLIDAEQQRRLNDFVARRGGGLVMLGGRFAFAEGGFANTPVARLAPVVLPSEPARFRKRVRIRPTASGLRHPLLEVAAREDVRETWTALPPLTMVNPIRRTKPGAMILLSADDGSGEPLVGLAWHRYGRGTVAAFPVRDSWRWQMHADVPLDDMSHERLWRQLLRHVARPAGGRLSMAVSKPVAAVGDTVTIEAEVLDRAYRIRADASPALEVIDPSGELARYRLSRQVDDTLGYRTRIELPQLGRYELRLAVTDSDGETLALERAIDVTATGSEFHAAELDPVALARLAARTGGRYFSLRDADDVSDHISDERSTHRAEQRIRLNNMPALLVLLIALLSLEWLWRRRCRLP